MTPTQQIEKRLKDTASINMIDRMFFEQKFRAYKAMRETENKVKWLTIKSQLRTIASFFSRNGLTLALKKGDWESTMKQKVTHRFKLELKDVKAMYNHANLRDKALLLILAQSGFSEIDVTEIKIEDIKDLYTMPQSEHYFIEKPREKEDFEKIEYPEDETEDPTDADLIEFGL